MLKYLNVNPEIAQRQQVKITELNYKNNTI